MDLFQKLLNMINDLTKHKLNVSVVFVTQILVAVGSLLAIRLFTEFISPDIFGQYKLVLSSISFGVGILTRPIIQFAMREYHVAVKNSIKESFLKKMGSLFNKYIGTIILVIGFTYFFISEFQQSKDNLIGSSILIVSTLIVLWLTTKIEFEVALLVSKNNQLEAGIIKAALKWCIPFTIITLIFIINESVFVMILGTILAQLLVWLSIIYFNKSDILFKDNHIYSESVLFSKSIKFGWPIAIIGVLSWLINESDRFFILYYHDTSEVGIYAAAYGLISAPFIMGSGAVAQFSFPFIFRDSVKSKNIISLVNKILLVNTLIVFVGILLVFFFKDIIAYIGLSEVYRNEALELFLWIAIGYGFFAMSTSFDLAAYGEKRTKDMLMSYLVASSINVILNFILIPNYASKGAVIATMISLISYFFSMAIIFYSRSKSFINDKI